MKPRIFVGSSREAIDVCRAIQGELDDDFDVTVWDQDIFRLSYGALDSLLDALDSSDAGVFVLRPDDLTESRGESSPTARDNVTFELGMFIGRLGRDRTFMLTPARSAVRLPSDLIGLTTARYDTDRFYSGQRRAAVGPACTKIRDALESIQLRRTAEPRSQARLDRAMRRMSKDLETVIARHNAQSGRTAGFAEDHGVLSLQLGRASVRVEVGRIQDYQSSDSRTVIALPANEYFDDECISDTNSSLGAFVQHHFGGHVDDFIRQVQAELVGIPTQRVPRAERRIDDSYGIGEAVFLNKLLPDYRLILVSATTERTGIGLRAEPHFLYAAIEGVVGALNEHRMNSLTMPVLGSGHGGMPFPVAVLFNLLAVRSMLADDLGRHLTEIRVVVSEKRSAELASNPMRDIISQVAPVLSEA
jgi:O-acetyl-ADP-ribose deacetylase (regulator of RNase III)